MSYNTYNHNVTTNHTTTTTTTNNNNNNTNTTTNNNGLHRISDHLISYRAVLHDRPAHYYDQSRTK